MPVDAAPEAKVATQKREDDAEATQDMARYARRVRRRLVPTRMELARHTDLPHEMIRSRERGKRGPTGAGQHAPSCGCSTRHRNPRPAR